MTRNEIVTAGHYCSKMTLNAEVKEIIRILGPNPKRPGYWVSDMNKSFSEDTLLDDYVPLNTAPNTERNKKIDIFKDFSKIEVDTDQIDTDTDPYQREIPEHLRPENQQPQSPQSPQAPPRTQQAPIDPFTELVKLLEKASIDALNNNYDKKYGTKPYKPLILTVPISIEIPYELSKLNQICELFDISEKEVAEYLFSKLELPKTEIIQLIHDKLTNRLVVDNNPEPKPKQPKPKVEIKEELGTGISEVEDYLNTLFNK